MAMMSAKPVNNGIFTPRDLALMCEELRRSEAPDEGPADREARAEMLVQTWSRQRQARNADQREGGESRHT